MIAACKVDLPGRRPPTEFRIFGRGTNGSDKGEFLFDDQAAASVMAAYRQHGTDLSIDYDHQALATPQVKAPAAGWFNLEVRDGELWATNVRWTPAAEEHLRDGEYRYFSPLFDFDPDTGRVRKLINTALTNTPALHGIDALVAASRHQPGGTMTRQGPPALDDDAKAHIAHLAGTDAPPSRASLSTTALVQKTDAEVLAALSTEQRRCIEQIVGDDPRAIAMQARKAAAVARARRDGEAHEEQLERGRVALANQR